MAETLAAPRSVTLTDLTKLPNIGKTPADELTGIRVTSVEQLIDRDSNGRQIVRVVLKGAWRMPVPRGVFQELDAMIKWLGELDGQG